MFSCAYPPLLHIPLQNVILDELHLMLRITGTVTVSSKVIAVTTLGVLQWWISGRVLANLLLPSPFVERI